MFGLYFTFRRKPNLPLKLAIVDFQLVNLVSNSLGKVSFGSTPSNKECMAVSQIKDFDVLPANSSKLGFYQKAVALFDQIDPRLPKAGVCNSGSSGREIFRRQLQISRNLPEPLFDVSLRHKNSLLFVGERGEECPVGSRAADS
jgi:hypothetical protein